MKRLLQYTMAVAIMLSASACEWKAGDEPNGKDMGYRLWSIAHADLTRINEIFDFVAYYNMLQTIEDGEQRNEFISRHFNGAYMNVEGNAHMIAYNTNYDTNYYTRPEIERILKVGFEYAMKRKKHLTVVDKANVLASSRLWRQIAQEMESLYPEVKTDYMYVDNAAMRMIQEPTFFDVMVTENTFGDILTDEGSVISGSMGLLPSASTGDSTPVFEPIHGSWPLAKGLNIANPLAQILSVAMLFEYFDLKEEGALIRKAVNASLDANVRTPEIQVQGGEKYGTKEVGAWIVDYIKKA